MSNANLDHQAQTSLWDRTVQHAIEEGIIAAPSQTAEATPWSTMALTFIGALISAALFLAALGLFFALIEIDGTGIVYSFSFSFIMGALAFLWRKSSHSLFLEMLMFIMLIAGLVLLSVILVIDSDPHISAVMFVMSVLTLICACIVYADWMRALGSFASAILLLASMLSSDMLIGHAGVYVLTLAHPIIAVALLFLQKSWEKNALWKPAQWLEPLLNGWLAATFLILAYFSGKAMFVGMFVPIFDAGMATGEVSYVQLVLFHLKSPLAWIQVLSLPLALLWGRWQQPFFKSKRLLVLALAVSAFSLIVPDLALCLALTLLAYATGRAKIAILGGLCGLWIVGSLYYLLDILLIEKAVWLAVMGVVLVAIAMIGGRSGKGLAGLSGKPERDERVIFANRRFVNMVLIAVTAVFALGGVNASIWKQEQVRAEGVQVFIPLAPVDPRSLMQGDYMDLRFSVPSEIASSEEGIAYLRMDEKGIGHFVPDSEEGNIRFLLERKYGQWGVAANAWFFKEGDAKRWEMARYGVFRVNGRGQSSLVGMADTDLKMIEMESKPENTNRVN